jgi:5-formyltetrahydrofolate cyclo-ligase
LLALHVSSSSGPTSGPRTSSKLVTRREALARRDALPAAVRAAASARICERVLADLTAHVTAPHAVIAVYAATRSEVDLAPLDAALRAAGFRVAYPRVRDAERALAFALAAPADLVAAASLALREPPASAPAIALADVAAFVVPGAAYDRLGHRLGWGRGHYDATFPAAPHARRLGVAFDCQLVAALAPEPHDVDMHAVITELATHEVP